VAGYIGWAELLDGEGAALDFVRAELLSDPHEGATRWSGDLSPMGKREFAPGVELWTGAVVAIRLPNGRSARCEVQRIRSGSPDLVRIGGIDPPPFG
jgi:hypothetical protein